MSLDDALAAYTAGGAYAEFQEEEKGKLRPGMLADLVLLDRNIAALAPEELPAVNVALTVCGGAIVYEA
jgi:predicted amidohydrolase YtcJ